MNSFLELGRLLSRGRRMKAYRQARREAPDFSDADLADMGLKRYQLGHLARAKATR